MKQRHSARQAHDPRRKKQAGRQPHGKALMRGRGPSVAIGLAIKPLPTVSGRTGLRRPSDAQGQQSAGPERATESVCEREMASSASCTMLLPTLSLAVILLALCARGGEARPPPPLHGVRPLAFDEGYTQIFGSANLALLRDGRRVRLTLDESTGELPCCPLQFLLPSVISGRAGGRIALLFSFLLPDRSPAGTAAAAAEGRRCDFSLTPGCCLRKPHAFLRPGAGFASQDVFLHGFFSAAIKLPADYAAGVVVAFYVSRS